MDLLDQISLEHVRLRGVRSDAAVARLRLSHLLATAGLRPPAMPPSAVLVVRSMADPLPGRIATELSAAAIASAEWEHAAQARLGELYSRAARPAWGPVSPSAEAVLFADYGELLACLADDVSSGSAGAWWWRSIVKRHGLRLPGSWTSFWAGRPRYIPSALQHLSARGQASAVLERIAPVQAWRLLVEVAYAFDLPDSVIPRSGPAGLHRVGGQTPQVASRRLPWEPYVPPSATPAALGLERRSLLGVGLLLCRAPAVALTSGFSFRFRDWLKIAEAARREVEGPPAAPLRRSQVLRNVDPATAMRSGAKPTMEESILSPVESADESPGKPCCDFSGELYNQPKNEMEEAAAAAFRDLDASRNAGTVPRTGAPPPMARTLPPRIVSTPEPQMEPRAEQRIVPPGEPPSSTLRETRLDWETGVVTRLGGILYLIHVVRQMELMRHFDTGLSGWALVELMARCLIGSTRAIGTDPIWDALAELDDRHPRTAPGDAFLPQATYPAPDSWVRNLDAKPPLVRGRARGTELWRPEGFLIMDSKERRIPCAGELVPFTRRERRRFRRAAEVRPAGVAISRELRRFLHFVLPYARWRLGQVLLGIAPEEAFLRHGRLVVSSSHVDLVMGMSQISLPVRLAGLDVNPGWVPELGRVVTFYFLAEGMGG